MVGTRENSDKMREGATVEDGLNAGIDTASEAAEGSGGLKDKGG